MYFPESYAYDVKSTVVVPGRYRVKLPEGYDANRAQPYPTVICVNGEAGFGPRDGKVSLTSSVCKTKGRSNELIVVECSFNTPTWLNDSSTMNHESYLLKVMLPHFRAAHNAGKMFLLGFGTGGYGALSLLMRRPNAFEAVVAADVPILGGYKAIERPWEVKDLDVLRIGGLGTRRSLATRIGPRTTSRRSFATRGCASNSTPTARESLSFPGRKPSPNSAISFVVWRNAASPRTSSPASRTTTSIDRAPGSTPRSIGSLQNSRKCHPRDSALEARVRVKPKRTPTARRLAPDPAQPPRPRRRARASHDVAPSIPRVRPAVQRRARAMTTEPSPRRVIVAGDAKGAFDALVARVETVHGNPKAGPFDAVFVAGRIYDGDDAAVTMEPYVAGTKSAPVPVYFIDADGEKGSEYAQSRAAAGTANESSSARGVLEIAPNVYFLSESRVYDLCGGLKVASLPGRYDVLSYEDAEITHEVRRRRGRRSRDDGGRRDVDEGEFRRYAEKGCRRCSSHERLAGGDAGHTRARSRQAGEEREFHRLAR